MVIMAKVIDENIQRQLDKKISFFVKYYPARIQNVGEDAKAAQGSWYGLSKILVILLMRK